jgi:hypothetical protein
MSMHALRHIACLRAHIAPRSAVTAQVALALLVLPLAGCATSGLPANASHNRMPGATPTSAQTGGSRGYAPIRTPTPAEAKGVKPCPGGVGSVTQAGAPALVLRPWGGALMGNVHPGALVQVQLPVLRAMVWSYDGTAPSWALLQPAGYEDVQRQVCVWNFRAAVVGTLTLKFTGTGICNAEGLCPVPVIPVTFTVRIQ